MKIKTAELVGTALSYAVAIAEAEPFFIEDGRILDENRLEIDYLTHDQGGPIIEREFISTNVLASGLILGEHPTFRSGDLWAATKNVPDQDEIECCGFNKIIAGLRCYVTWKLGDEVEVPEEVV